MGPRCKSQTMSMKEIGFDAGDESLISQPEDSFEREPVLFPMEEWGWPDSPLEFESGYHNGTTLKLMCPCGGGDLHQIETRTIFRKEDQDGTLTISTEEKTEVRPIRSSNIPGRRDVLGVCLWCECCQGTVYLCVRQHKGGTFLYLAKDTTSE